ncbi:acetyltransferase [Vibrio parahaemolyticus]|nr:acetyltransferase [Vibrio parahaemolyticus]EGR3101772.1 acetyltransferase [Vibrio parahaemolyticus]
MAQCFRFWWKRCSPLNWALALSEENNEICSISY